MILVDPLFDTTPHTRAKTPRCFRNAQASHMVSDLPGEEGTRELLAFAQRIGLRPAWLQNPGTHREHFDLTAPRHAAAVALGAREVTSREMAEAGRAKRRAMAAPPTEPEEARERAKENRDGR